MKKSLIYKIICILVLIAICAIMMVIGRGHTIYFDNKTYEKNGKTISSYNRATVIVKGEEIDKLAKNERTMVTTLGQSFTYTVKIRKEKNDDEKEYVFKLKLPYNMDGIILNIPAMVENLSQDEYLEEFVPKVEEVQEEETVNTDEFNFAG